MNLKSNCDAAIRSKLTLALLLMGALFTMGVLSGCVGVAELVVGTAVDLATPDIDETEIRGAWGVKSTLSTPWPRHMIKPDKTTKSEVQGRLSIPDEKTSDSRIFLYRYQMQNYNVRKDDENVVERIPVGRPSSARFLIWFDQTDVVRRYRWHDGQPTAASALKCHSANQLCEMIKGLQEQQLIAQYC